MGDKIKEPLFKIGQEVRVSADGEVGVVQQYSFDGESFKYVVSSKEVDLKKKEIVNGVKHVAESELEEIESEEVEK